ncbi:MAG TPA: deoxyribonuclease IV [Actinomycetota bacterium]|nr:deoxyribonuclease IV [Actinomycetota bacterium]
MRIGAHVRRRAGSVAGGVEEARKRGADCAQVFLSNPRGWAPPHPTDEEAAAFRAVWEPSDLRPLVAHAPYLVNVASANAEFLERSRALARNSLAACAAFGVDVLVVHAGTGGNDPPDRIVERAADSLRTLALEGPTRLAVELEEGIPAASASTIEQAAVLLEAADLPDVGLCLDTCHLFVAGYELDRESGVARLFDELRATGLLDRVVLFHANDAVFPCGSRRDRHENIGDGFIGLEGFHALITRPEVLDLAFILETPGDAERQARDIAVLRSWATG